MNMIFRLLGALPRNGSVPLLVLLAGWYGGAKYGAPDYVMNGMDGIVKSGTTMVGGLLNQDEDDTAAEDTDSAGG